MSTGARTTSTGSAAPGTSTDRSERPRDPAGILLGRLTVLPALLAMAWLLVGLPLLLAGAFTPVVMLVLAVPLAAVLVTAGLRWTPGQMQGPLLLAPARPARRVRAADGARAAPPAAAAEPAAGKTRPVTPWWAVAAIILVAVAFGIDQLYFHSQNIIVNRDPASYANFGYWLAQHGSLPIPQERAPPGGPPRRLDLARLSLSRGG